VCLSNMCRHLYVISSPLPPPSCQCGMIPQFTRMVVGYVNTVT
jgi:hypothetical protein